MINIGYNHVLCERTTALEDRGNSKCSIMKCLTCSHESPPWWNISMAERCCPECKSKNIRIIPYHKPYKLPSTTFTSTTVQVTTNQGITYTAPEKEQL